MDFDTSSFGNVNEQYLTSSFAEVTPLRKKGATSDCSKVRIFEKWHFLKRPKTEFISNPIYLAAFEKEFDLGISIDHPNIVRYISKGYDKEGIYILTEFVDGLSLDELFQVKPNYFKNKANVKKILSQLLSSLSYLHNRQIVHADIKPENILIAHNGNNVKLVDLGLSYSDCYNEITGGSKGYGSPEQFTTPNEISYKSDMYAVGKIILFIFNGNTNERLLGKLPQPYRSIAKRCLVTNLEKRTITANQALQLLNKSHFPVFGSVVLFLALLGVMFFVSFSKYGLKDKSDEKFIQDTTATVSSADSSILINKPIDKIKETPLPKIKYNKPVEEKKANPKQLEIEITNAIEKRLSPNIAVLQSVFSEITEDDIPVLKHFFNDWKATCKNDLDLLYSDYENVISYEKFKSIYGKELAKINDSIEKKLNEIEK
ncbi:MAG: protein kinase [Bacteroidales bacterium]|nr:protein kinase [Bacteroidales bacterium]